MEKSKVVLFIASTLDGFIATEDHKLDWLFEVEGEGDNGISEFYNSIQSILMGRTTYQWIMDHEKNFPYKDKQNYVFTRQKLENTEFVQFINDDPKTFLQKLKDQNDGDIWLMGGGELIKTFLDEQLVDKIILTFAPLVLGKGISLFRGQDFMTKLKLQQVRTFGQFVELQYDVLK